MPAYTLRRAAARDADALFHIRTRVRENALTLAELAELGLTPETVRAMLHGEPDCWVAEADGEAIGFSMADMRDGCLFALFVLPGREGRGVGAGLLSLAEEALFSRHAEIWLETARNCRAAAFYLRRGWIEGESAASGDVRMTKMRDPALYSPSSSG